MFFQTWGLARFSLGVSIAAYAVGIVLAGTVTALGCYRVIATVLAELTPIEAPEVASPSVPVRSQQITSAPQQTTTSSSSARQAFMTPLHAGGFVNLSKTAASLPRVSQPAFFGSSSRYWGRPSRRDRDEDDDEDRERLREAGTYRTMCVRMCDGYYFPISFSATTDRFARDAKVCESSCGEARLFVYRNPGADVEDMVDLRGQPYRQLKTAFLYRTEYVAACRCKPNPWDAEAQERHRMYALAAAKRKGDKQAAAELAALTAKTKQDRSARRSVQVATPAPAAAPEPAPAAPANTATTPEIVTPRVPVRADDKTGRMALGARQPAQRPARTSGRDPEWMARALGRSF